MEVIKGYSVRQRKVSGRTGNETSNHGNRTIITGSTQDFLYHTWWERTGHPNVIFHQATVVHDCRSFKPEEYKLIYHDFFQKVSNYTKKYGSVYFWSNSPRVWPSKVPKIWRNVTHNVNIMRYNTIVIDVIPQDNFHLQKGLDLYAQSEGLNGNDYTDGIHHIPLWYQSVSRQLVQRFCALNSV